MSGSLSEIPSATTYFGVLFTNLGPLTTTYTAPLSCETVNTNRVIFVDKSMDLWVEGKPECYGYWTAGDCIPSGTDIDNWVEVARTATTKKNAGAYWYHSPGIACPQGWTTVGMIAKDNETMSVSGFMTGRYKGYEDAAGWPTTAPRPMEITEYWNGFLETSQTVAFCGPM